MANIFSISTMNYLCFSILASILCSFVAAQDGYATENGGVTGGAGGTTTTVSSLAAFETAILQNEPTVVYLSGPLELDDRLSVSSDTSIIGVGSKAIITGGGLRIDDASNVVVQNLVINKVVGDDAISVQESTNVWIDHNEFYSDTDHGFDYYDGQVDITHGCDYVTVSYNYFHDHYKCSLVGADPDNADEDTGKFHITYHHNYFQNIHTRTPAARYAHIHSYNNLFEDIVSQGIHMRSEAEALIEANVFVNSVEPLSTYGFVIPDDSPADPEGDYEDDGFANLGADNDFGSGEINITQTGTFTSVPYNYTLTPLDEVQALVQAHAGVGKI
ncbi:polysaccharide lyase family 1 protein [Schizophyllum amplum]|uniref:Polysaccharide lyase family 1 protein n=1 Tax=Schizophyllum amplum TaxID=97359 RepID=A0A550CI02_9AGAR|nr:polysaccharide lyase family 1 protein [Auriculariopsis ampla]